MKDGDTVTRLSKSWIRISLWKEYQVHRYFHLWKCKKKIVKMDFNAQSSGEELQRMHISGALTTYAFPCKYLLSLLLRNFTFATIFFSSTLLEICSVLFLFVARYLSVLLHLRLCTNLHASCHLRVFLGLS